MLTAFFDELGKIAAITSSTPPIPAKPGEVKQPVRPKQLKARTISPTQSLKGKATSYTRSNVEAPGTDVTVTAPQKSLPPPPITA